MAGHDSRLRQLCSPAETNGAPSERSESRGRARV